MQRKVFHIFAALVVAGLCPIAAYAEDGYDTVMAAAYAEDGYDTVMAAAYAEDGYATAMVGANVGTTGISDSAESDAREYPGSCRAGVPAAPCCAACCCDPCRCDCGTCAHRTGLFAESLYLHPTDADVVFGIPQMGIGGMGTVPVGGVGVADPDFQQGYRAGFSFCLECESSLVGAYTWYENDTNAQINVGGANVINPVVLFPGAFNAGGTAQQANAAYGLDFNTADLDYKFVWCGCPGRYVVNLLVGVRYAELQQDLSVIYPFATPDGQEQLATDIEFSGTGLRLGIEGERFLHPRINVSVYGRGIANVLSGEFRASYVETNQFNGTVANISWQDDRTIAILEAEAGIAWSSACGRLRISAGYYLASWRNAVTTTEWIQAVQATAGQAQAALVEVGDTPLTFGGFVGRIELRR